MNESDYHVRIQALTQLLNELKARMAAMEQRLIAAEQSLQQRWYNA